MDLQNFRGLQEAYVGVYGGNIQDEVDFWVSELIEEGYDIDEYTDEELLEVFLDERKNEDPKGVANRAGINKPDAWGPPTPFGQEATRNSLAAGMRGVRKLQQAGVRINRHHRNKYLAHKVHQGWAKAAENSPHQTPEQQARRLKLINKDLESFRKNLSKPERDKDVPFVKKAERAVNKQGEFAEHYVSYEELNESSLADLFSAANREIGAENERITKDQEKRIRRSRELAAAATGVSTVPTSSSSRKRKPGEALKDVQKTIAKIRELEKESENVRENLDIHDLILSHLLDEGYANTPEAAEIIMENLSEGAKTEFLMRALGTAATGAKE